VQLNAEFQSWSSGCSLSMRLKNEFYLFYKNMYLESILYTETPCAPDVIGIITSYVGDRYVKYTVLDTNGDPYYTVYGYVSGTESVNFHDVVYYLDGAVIGKHSIECDWTPAGYVPDNADYKIHDEVLAMDGLQEFLNGNVIIVPCKYCKYANVVVYMRLKLFDAISDRYPGRPPYMITLHPSDVCMRGTIRPSDKIIPSHGEHSVPVCLMWIIIIMPLIIAFIAYILMFTAVWYAMNEP
jgi:hypothetical protein